MLVGPKGGLLCDCEIIANLDDQPKLRGSGVVATLVCEYPKDPDPTFQYLDTNRD